jgi:putative acetyltransferase
MFVVVREVRSTEARLFFDLHERSVRGLAASHYAPEVIDAWVVPQTEDILDWFARNPDGEIRLIAELDGQPVGLGSLVVSNAELRSCYVVPEAARKGVGSALVREIERLAREHGLTHLQLFASVNAEPFYTSAGYQSDGRTEYGIRGQRMDAVKMSKSLL